jgi:hypothetical protein
MTWLTATEYIMLQMTTMELFRLSLSQSGPFLIDDVSTTL